MIFSLAANVICKNPTDSNSRARFKLPASNTSMLLPFNASTILSLASCVSYAKRTVVGA